jgi:hypothetical protein
MSNLSEHPDAVEAAAQGFESEEHKTRHGVAVVFHFAFKVAAVLWYLLSGLVLSGFVLTFVVQVLLLAFDFWTVKNVTGRLLVGLRWWQELKADGTQEWVFEAKEDQSTVVNAEKRLFWIGVIAAPLAWGVLGVLGLFSLISLTPLSVVPKLLVCALGLGLSLPNLYGYLKCSKESADKFRGMAQSYIGNAAINAALRRVTTQ